MEKTSSRWRVSDNNGCESFNKQGTPCKSKRVRYCPTSGAWRCRWHGASSYGARTEEGRRRSLEALRAGHAAWRAQMKSGGPQQQEVMPDARRLGGM